jgi:hypothetical protein
MAGGHRVSAHPCLRLIAPAPPAPLCSVPYFQPSGRYDPTNTPFPDEVGC